MKKILLLAISIFWFTTLFASDKDKKEEAGKPAYDIVFVSGNVSDYNTGETLVGVEVRLEGADVKTYTDFDGNFQFEGIKAGEYNIIINYISYENKTIEKKKIELFSEPIEIKLEPQK